VRRKRQEGGCKQQERNKQEAYVTCATVAKTKAKGEQKVVKMALDTSLVPWHKSQNARGIRLWNNDTPFSEAVFGTNLT